MLNSIESSWYAVQCKPFGESMVASHLRRLEICVFLPLIRQEQNVCGTDRWLTKPLFSGYVFARFRLEDCYQAVRYAPRVVRVLGSRSKPLPVPEEIIRSIQERVQRDGFVRVERPAPSPGDQVILEGGCFAGWMGRVERECDDRKRVLILLESLHQSWLVVERRFALLAAAAT